MGRQMLRMIATVASTLGLGKAIQNQAWRRRLYIACILICAAIAIGFVSWFINSFLAIADQSVVAAVAYGVFCAAIGFAVYWFVRRDKQQPTTLNQKSVKRMGSAHATEIRANLLDDMITNGHGQQQVIAIVGLPKVGKKTLVRYLDKELEGAFQIDIRECSVDPLQAAAGIKMVPAGAWVLYVAAQDLFSYEMSTLEQLDAAGANRIDIVLSKADLISHGDRTDILASIRNKCRKLASVKNVVCVAIEPAAVTVMRELPDGTREQNQQEFPSETDELIGLFERSTNDHG